jgi:VWFA-related protein
MLRYFVAALFAVLVPAALGARPVTVAQLDQLLTSHQHDSDSSLAERLADLQLTERAATPQLLRWEAEFKGTRTRMALIGLADSSAFLDPPPGDQPSLPRPDIKAQEEMVVRTINYLKTMVTKLPNFFASRDTVHFEDTPPPADLSIAPPSIVGMPQFLPNPLPLHMVSRYSVIVRYRDGDEIQETKKNVRAPDANFGLSTRGEFGPILTMVLSDALHSSTVWQRWEIGSNGPIAVLRYQVPKGKSGYTVVLPKDHTMVPFHPAYHGAIAIDPAHGDILRLTIITDLDPIYKPVTTGIMVEYGPVTIGEQTYTCPLRAVAYSRMPQSGDPGVWAAGNFPLLTRINDVAFTQYHLFHSGSRIIDTAEVDPSLRVQPSEEEAATVASPVPPVTETPAATAPVASSTPAASPAPAPVEPANSETSTANPPSISPPGPANVLHAHARLVLVDVVATNHGNLVHGLDRNQLHIFEDGHEQRIASFEEHTPRPTTLTPQPALPAFTFTNIPALQIAGPLNILLLDSLNTPPQNVADAQDRLLKFVHNAPQGTAMAVFALGGQLSLIQGFSTDTALIAQAIKSGNAVARRSLPRNTGGSDPAANTDSAMQAMVAMAKTAQARQAISHTMQQTEQHEQDAQAEVTAERVRATLEALQQLAQYLAAIPGRKNLIWISGSFPAALIADPAETIADQPDQQRNNHDFTQLIQQAGQAMAAARVAVYPIDARGIMTMPSTKVDVEQTHSVSLNASGNLQPDPTNVAHVDSNFRSTTGLEHGSMQQIAEDTGGHAFVDTNDLQQAVAKVIDNGASYYTIGYVPPDRPDTQFRNVLVKTDTPNLALSYRRGYYSATPVSPVGKPSAAGVNIPLSTAVTLGVPPSTQILFRARILPATDPLVHYVPVPSESTGAMTGSIKGPTRRFVIDLTLDPATLTLQDDPQGAHHVQFDCALVAYDAAAKRVNALDRHVRLDMTASQYQQVLTAGVPFQVALDLPATPVTLRLAVYDPATGHTGTIETPITSRGN